MQTQLQHRLSELQQEFQKGQQKLQGLLSSVYAAERWLCINREPTLRSIFSPRALVILSVAKEPVPKARKIDKKLNLRRLNEPSAPVPSLRSG